MSKPDLLKTRTAAALLLAAAVCAQGAWAQSGRKAPKTSTPAPPVEVKPQGESESGPARDPSKKTDALVSFAVMRGDEGAFTIVDPLAQDGVADNFFRRLGASTAVSVTSAGSGNRSDARKRAKAETTAYVVYFLLEEENYAAAGTGRADSRRLVIKTYVYTPKTGDLKYADTTFQRPYRQTARIGGVPVPVPTRGIERYPSQRELEQAARDAADRLLARFHVSPPPDN